MATNRMPVIFLAHGAPYFMDDNGEMIGPDALPSRRIQGPARLCRSNRRHPSA